MSKAEPKFCWTYWTPALGSRFVIRSLWQICNVNVSLDRQHKQPFTGIKLANPPFCLLVCFFARSGRSGNSGVFTDALVGELILWLGVKHGDLLIRLHGEPAAVCQVDSVHSWGGVTRCLLPLVDLLVWINIQAVQRVWFSYIRILLIFSTRSRWCSGSVEAYGSHAGV